MLAEVNYKNYYNEILELNVTGYGSNKEKALENAQKRAIEILLFRGIPNSSLSKPMINTSEAKVKEEHKEYFTDFFNNKRFLSFITFSASNTPINMMENNKKGYTSTIKINVLSLRTDLENNGIIRKFGY